MKLWLLVSIAFPLFAFAAQAQAPYEAYVAQYTELLQVDQPITPPTTPETAPGRTEVVEATVESQIHDIALKHGIDPVKFYTLIKCENRDLDPNAQSNLRYSFSDPKRGIVKGSREVSFGLLQAHLPDHPQVTMAQATSAEWSLNWGAEHIKAGRTWMWKTCSRVAGF